MSSEQFAKAPLLYIHQADTKKINAKMQHHYHTTSKKVLPKNSTVENEEKIVRKQQSKNVRTESFYDKREAAMDVVPEKEGETEKIVAVEKVVENTTEQKPFQKMNLEEQLNYLTKKPAYAPRLTCEIKTEERVYRGVILEYIEGIVSLRSGKRTIEIQDETIKQIRMLSL